FHHCGAHYLYDFDNPAGACYEWSSSKSCWNRGSGCKTHVEQRKLIARKANLCEVPLIAVEGKRCTTTPYTFDRSQSCDGWSGLTEQECMEKCNDNAKAPNCPRKTCRAAAFYPKSGWCHLYESCPETKPFDSATAIIDKVPMKGIEGVRCKSRPYTFSTADQSNICDGWSGLTENQCALKCSGNERAKNCPQKTCVAAAFYKGTGWCHLYDSCPDMDEVSTATAIIPEAARWCRGSVIPDTAWSCEEITDSNECANSFTRSKDGHYFQQCAITSLLAFFEVPSTYPNIPNPL
ncbi:unnamed protein product, partial [Symbiodinium pilosum]